MADAPSPPIVTLSDIVIEYEQLLVKTNLHVRFVKAQVVEGTARKTKRVTLRFNKFVTATKELQNLSECLDDISISIIAHEMAIVDEEGMVNHDSFHQHLHDVKIDTIFDFIDVCMNNIVAFRIANPEEDADDLMLSDDVRAQRELLHCKDLLRVDKKTLEDQILYVQLLLEKDEPKPELRGIIERMAYRMEKFCETLKKTSLLSLSTYRPLEAWRLKQVPTIEQITIDVDKYLWEVERLEKDKPSVYLEPQRIPEFSGDLLDFLEWKASWNELMGPQRLLEPQELIYLRNALPDIAQRKIVQITSLSAVWKILDAEYGDTKLIIQILKSNLKTILPVGKEDFDKFISVYDSMTYLVKRLEFAGAGELLVLERDYVSAVYISLPKAYQVRWDEYKVDDFDNEWVAFTTFMVEQHAIALRKRVLNVSIQELTRVLPKDGKPTREKCTLCNKKGHTSKTCYNVTVNVATVTKDGVKHKPKPKDGTTKSVPAKSVKVVSPPTVPKSILKPSVPSTSLSCILCKTQHTYVRRTNTSATIQSSDRLSNCRQFRNMSVNDRAEFLKKNDCCLKCTSWTHITANCRLPDRPCGAAIPGGLCQETNHCAWIHGQTTITFNLLDYSTRLNVLLPIQEISFGKGVTANLLYDTGSTSSLITYDLANKLGLKGQEVTRWVQVTGRKPRCINTRIFLLTLPKRDGTKVKIHAYGIDNITGIITPVNTNVIAHIFPHLPIEVLRRPCGTIDILLGMVEAKLLPRCVEVADDLRIEKTEFGTGWIISGTHPDLDSRECVATPAARKFLDEDAYHTSSQERYNLIRLPGHQEAEDLAIAHRRASLCVSCTTKTKDLQEMPIRARDELDMIKNGISLNESTKTIYVSYPVIGNIKKLSNNFLQAKAICTSLIRRLTALKMHSAYDDLFLDMIARGVLIPVSNQQIEEWTKSGGVINFISHHGVMKKSSLSTPIRVVWNSSLKNNNSGISINDLLAKGTNSLNNLFEVLVRFRYYKYGITWDLSKAYNSLVTGEKEKFFRLCVWCHPDSQEFVIYGATRVMFGDRPAANCLEIAKDLVAMAGHSISVPVATKIINDCYVDDGVTGTNDEDELKKMVGCTKIDKSGEEIYDGTLAQILSLGGLSLKIITTSLPSDAIKDSTMVVGHMWYPTEDLLKFKFYVNLKEKTRGITVEEDIVTTLDTLKLSRFTPRLCLRLVQSLYDPLGLCSPYISKLKILLRTTTKLSLSWDEELPENLQTLWRQSCEDLLLLEEISFPRSIMPIEAVGLPSIIGFFDGSEEAYTAKVYARFKLLNGSTKVTLISSKARTVPIRGLTIPRVELNGLLILTRLVNMILKSLPTETECIVLYGDSQCIIAAVNNTNLHLNTYFRNRITEVTDYFKLWKENGHQVLPVRWIPGESNPADLGTRPTVSAQDISPGSTHQIGPEWLQHHPDTWPQSTTPNDVSVIPAAEVRQISCLNLILMTPSDYLCPEYDFLKSTNNWQRARRIAARISRAISWEELNSCRVVSPLKNPRWICHVKPLMVGDFERGDRFLELLSLKHTIEMLSKNKLESLAIFYENGLCYTRGRLGSAMSPVLGKDKLIVLAPGSQLAQLIMIQSHSQDHRRQPNDALFRSRKHAYIVKGISLAKKIIKNCQGCKILKWYLNNNSQVQQMGSLPLTRVMHSKPFVNIAIDFFGPYLVKGLGNSRAKVKAFPIIIACQVSGAVSIKVCNGYSTQALLEQLMAHFHERGQPKTIYSDVGTQLVAAAASLGMDPPSRTDWDNLRQSCAQLGTTWDFAPAQAQHRNGLAESRVKAIKHALDHLKPDSDLNYVQFQVLLIKISHLINERPLALKKSSNSADDLTIITPNMLILGHSGEVPVPTAYLKSGVYQRSLKLIEQVEAEWWKIFYRQIFPTLHPYTKWSTLIRNIEVGDVCALKNDQTKMNTGEYRLCRVTKVMPDKFGLVRTVVIDIPKRDTRIPVSSTTLPGLRSMTVAIQRLVVIVAADEVPT